MTNLTKPGAGPRVALRFALTLALLVAFALSAAAQTTIEFIYLAGADATEEGYRALAEAFEAANPDIKVERIRVISAYPDRVISHIASGTLPDVVAVDMNDIMAFGDEKILVDLGPFVEKTPGYEPEYLAAPLLDIYTVDGKLFSIPVSANPSAYVYNIDLFNEAGLAPPGDLYARGDWTWDAFRDAARKITRRGPEGNLSVLGAAIHLPRTWIFSNGGREFDDSKRPTRTYYDSPEAVEALQFIHSLIWQDGSSLMNNRVSSQLGADDIVSFSQGRVGMASRWLASMPGFAAGGVRLGMVPYPKGPGPNGQVASDLGPFGLSISATSKNIEAAWRFIAFVTGPEGAQVRAQLGGGTPPRPVRLDWMADMVVNPEVYGDLLVAGTSRVISKNRVDIQRIIDTELTPVWDNVTPVETAVTEIVRRIESYLQENPQ